MLKTTIRLRVEEAHQFRFIPHAEGRPDGHVAEDGGRDRWRKALWRVVTTRAVLAEDAGSGVFMLWPDGRGRVDFSRVLVGWLGLGRCLRKGDRCAEQCGEKEDRFSVHNHFPFQAGVRNR